MKPNRFLLRSMFAGVAALVIAGIGVAEAPPARAESAVKVVVNNTAITNGDIARRAAFLRLRREKGNLAQKARDELIEEALERDEIVRLGVSVSTADVDASFVRFAEGNKLKPEQLAQLLEQAGVGVAHFKAYIGIQMSWPRVVNIKYGESGRMTSEDFITRLKENNGKKPTVSEYILQQVIFVVPANKKGKITGKRKSEAEASRKAYPGCDGGKAFAANYRDVSVRNLGRFLEPELPVEWKDKISKLQTGQTTTTQVTDKGVEYISVCKRREVTDDQAAQMVFEAQDLAKAEAQNDNPNSRKYIEALKKKAEIIIK